MITLFTWVAAAVLIASLPYGLRVIRGPTVFDRLGGLNALGTKVAVLAVLAGVIYERIDMFVDIALGFFLLNIVTTLLIAIYMRRFKEPAS